MAMNQEASLALGGGERKRPGKKKCRAFSLAKSCRLLPHSKVVLLAGGAGVLVHVPLDVAVLVLEGAGPDLEQAHRHAGADLCQLDALVARLYKDVVADLYAVVDVFEGDDAGTEFGRGLARGEQVLQDLYDAAAQGRGEAFEDEVRVALADGAALGVGDVGAQHHVVQREAGGGAVGEVADCHCGGRAAVFVDQDHVAEARALGRADEVVQDQVAAVQAHGGGQQKTNLLGKGAETAAGVARGGDEDARVDDAREVRVFVVQLELFLGGAVRAGFVVAVVGAQGLVVGD